DYIKRHGRPTSLDEVGDHVFIGSADEVPRAPFFAWLKKNIPASNIGYQVNEITAARPAVVAGLGIGFSTTWAEADNDEMEMVFEPRPEWNSQLWLVTHVDLHRTAKVQTFVSFLKDWATRWPDQP
ncbi:MAG: substrate-binding domain-containing protein, partial [Jannaschia sp.]